MLIEFGESKISAWQIFAKLNDVAYPSNDGKSDLKDLRVIQSWKFLTFIFTLGFKNYYMWMFSMGRLGSVEGLADFLVVVNGV